MIKGLEIFAYHGVNPEEKENGQNFILDIECGIDLSRPCVTDDLNDTVSYAKIIKTARRVFTAEKYDLIEKAAETVAQAILEEYPPVGVIDLTLKKPEAPVKAKIEWAAVAIRRERR